MATGRGHQQEQNLQNQAQAATTAAAVSNPFQQQQQARAQHFFDQADNGTDVRQIDALRPAVGAYDAAVAEPVDQAGVGLLGSNALTGANGQLASLIGQQNASRRQQDASGELMHAFDDTSNQMTNEGNIASSADVAQRMGVANMANQRYSTYLNRPRQPSIWEQLLQGGMQAATAFI